MNRGTKEKSVRYQHAGKGETNVGPDRTELVASCSDASKAKILGWLLNQYTISNFMTAEQVIDSEDVIKPKNIMTWILGSVVEPDRVMKRLRI